MSADFANPGNPQTSATASFRYELAYQGGTTAGVTAIPTNDAFDSFLWTRSPTGAITGGCPQSSGQLAVLSLQAGNLTDLIFFGDGAEDDTFDGVAGYYKPLWYKDSSGEHVQYEPVVMARFTVTLGARTGIAGGIVDDSMLWADTITISVNQQPSPYGSRVTGMADQTGSPSGSDGIASLLLDALGASQGFVYLLANGDVENVGCAYKTL